MPRYGQRTWSQTGHQPKSERNRWKKRDRKIQSQLGFNHPRRTTIYLWRRGQMESRHVVSFKNPIRSHQFYLTPRTSLLELICHLIEKPRSPSRNGRSQVPNRHFERQESFPFHCLFRYHLCQRQKNTRKSRWNQQRLQGNETSITYDCTNYWRTRKLPRTYS